MIAALQRCSLHYSGVLQLYGDQWPMAGRGAGAGCRLQQMKLELSNCDIGLDGTYYGGIFSMFKHLFLIAS